MASGTIRSRQKKKKKKREKVGALIVFLFLGSKVTADGDCSPEIRRYLLLGRKAITIN